MICEPNDPQLKPNTYSLVFGPLRTEAAAQLGKLRIAVKTNRDFKVAWRSGPRPEHTASRPAVRKEGRPRARTLKTS